MSGGRKPQIDNSPFRDEIRALLKDKGHSEDPTYAELAETIEERYDEDLTEGQLRDYMNKEIEPDEKMPPKQAQQEIEKRRDTIDIASKRQELVEIQESRMEQTLETEEQMDGLVLEQASDMIMMYDKLLESLSGSYERLGILQSTTDIEINMNQMQAGDPFGELVEQSIEAEIEATDDDHADYKEGELVVEDVSEDEDGGGEVDEEEFLDKDPDEITFDDLPDEER